MSLDGLGWVDVSIVLGGCQVKFTKKLGFGVGFV